MDNETSNHAYNSTELATTAEPSGWVHRLRNRKQQITSYFSLAWLLGPIFIHERMHKCQQPEFPLHKPEDYVSRWSFSNNWRLSFYGQNVDTIIPFSSLRPSKRRDLCSARRNVRPMHLNRLLIPNPIALFFYHSTICTIYYLLSVDSVMKRSFRLNNEVVKNGLVSSLWIKCLSNVTLSGWL